GSALVDLNTVADVGLLDLAMTSLYSDASDRQFAAQQLLRFLIDQRQHGRVLANVGAIARVTVDPDAIDRSRSLGPMAQRLQGAREKASAEGGVVSAHVSLFTAADVAALKPLVAVRTRQEFRREAFASGC